MDLEKADNFWLGVVSLKTEQEIIEKAFMLFLQDGFSAMSTNEIIREAGLTKGGFYYVFKSREELIQKVIDHYIKPYFLEPTEQMEQIWCDKKKNIDTKTLLWDGFFAPQQFANYCSGIGLEIPFRDFYLLIYDGLKKFPEVLQYSLASSKAKGEALFRILERGKERKEIMEDIDLAEYSTLILAMQDGILALRVLDEKIQDDEKYKKIIQQMIKDIGVKASYEQGLQGGVRSAVS